MPTTVPNPGSDAAKAIVDKAERTLAKLKPNDRKAEEKRRQAAAMLSIASQFDSCHASRAAELGALAATDTDRQAAAIEVYSLATRRQSAATTHILGVQSRSGWIKGGDDFGALIQPDRLREVIVLFDIALSLHDESFWAYTKGLLQERLGDFAGAARTFENMQGQYAAHSAPHAQRCRRKLAGNYNAEGELDAAFDQLMRGMEQAGGERALHSMEIVGKLRGWLSAAQEPMAEDETEHDAEAADTLEGETSELDLAATTAQTFAELLVDGDFENACAMLAKNLKKMGATNLARAYTEMIGQYSDDGELPDQLAVCVMSSEDGMPNMRAQDLGWVYVAISGEGFSEAVTVTVTRERNALRIRELEWGRP
jgi:tetratricopeptide (TPR) repeat protein